MGERKTRQLRLHYYDEERSPDVVAVGGWEIVQMERKYRDLDLTDPTLVEPTYYLAFLGAKRGGLVPADQSFEQWGATVALPEEVEEPGESQAPPAT